MILNFASITDILVINYFAILFFVFGGIREIPIAMISKVTHSQSQAFPLGPMIIKTIPTEMLTASTIRFPMSFILFSPKKM